jgi:AcrR family transcriptional regulator
MATRLSRIEQTERNRSLVLQAARDVFMERGYHGATLEQIAEAAGFSKGVVYSQFKNKADLFLALLEKRIDERADENAQIIEGLAGAEGVVALLEHVGTISRATPKWGLLVAEFRVHAARHPELNRRYAAAHGHTIERLAGVLDTLYTRAGEQPPFPPHQMAEVIMAIGVGTELEQAANKDALQGPLAAELLARVITRDAS